VKVFGVKAVEMYEYIRTARIYKPLIKEVIALVIRLIQLSDIRPAIPLLDTNISG
jgi:hypothetical protein